MKLIAGNRYRGTASVGLLGVFSPEQTAALALKAFGFRDVTVTTTIPGGWPSEHRDADVFASGTWDKPTGEYELPSEVTWIQNVTPPAKQYKAGRYYVIVSPTSVGLRDVLEAEALEKFLGSRFKDVSQVVHDDETLFTFAAPAVFAWEFTGAHSSLPEPGDGKKEFELTPGQREYVDSSSNMLATAVKTVAVVGVGLVVLNALLSRR